jgi:formylglycine-generating enzyme required for sulfatase activity
MDSLWAPVGTAALGAGPWGQLDLVGEVYEWNLDWNDENGNPWDSCADCAYLTPGASRLAVGCSSSCQEADLRVPSIGGGDPAGRDDQFGVRCARAP